MKNLIYTIALLLFCVLQSYGQTPFSFKYQAVARNAENQAYQNQNLKIKLSVIEDDGTGTGVGPAIFTETHDVSTSDLGLFSLDIGRGFVLAGVFETIDWAAEAYWLEIEMDPDAGNDFVYMGKSQLLAVPYALHAKTAENVDDADANPTNEIQDLVFDENTKILSISSSNAVDLSGLSGGSGGSDDQNLSLIGTNLSIEGGNTIDLGILQDGTIDSDADPQNEIQNLTFDVNTNLLSISDGNSVSIPTGGTDADADPQNEIQTISKVGSTVSLSNNGGSYTDEVDDADANPQNEIQNLTFDQNTNLLSISDGNSVSIPTGGTDADADPQNEIQTISKVGDTVTLSNNGGSYTDEVDDNDADSQNEIQTISKAGNTISLSNNGGSYIDEFEDADSDAQNEIQTISKVGTTVTLSNNGGSYRDDVDDDDADPQNEIQTISKIGNEISLSNGGGTITDAIDDADADPTNEFQDLSLTGTSLQISDGNNVDLSIIQDGFMDDDSDPNNEIQDLSIDVNNKLQISDGNSVSLANYISPWNLVGNGISYNTGTTFTDAIQTNVITSMGNDYTAQFDHTGIELKNGFALEDANFKVDKLEFFTGLNSSTLKSNQLHFSGAGTSTLSDNNLNFMNTNGQFTDLGAFGLSAYDIFGDKDLILNLTDGLSMYANNKSFKYDWNQLDFINDLNGNGVSLYPGSMIFYNDHDFNAPSALFNDVIASFVDGSSNGVLKAGELTFTNNGIGNLARLSGDIKGRLQLFNTNFKETIVMSATAQNTGYLNLRDNAGNVTIGLSHVGGNVDHGYLHINSGNKEKAVIFAHSDNYGLLRLRGSNETTNVLMSSTNGSNGSLGLYDDNDSELVRLRAIKGQAGLLDLYATNVGANSRNIAISWLSGYAGHGYMAVCDWGGDPEAGMYVDSDGKGRVFADIKNFRMDHPEKKGKEIWYASLEGPEAGAYERGTSQLDNGETFVEYSEHFKLVGNPETMTVSLTPLSADTYGLAVIEKTANGFRVKELAKGKGNFDFDWEVKCVRKGYEDYKVIRDESESRIGGVRID